VFENVKVYEMAGDLYEVRLKFEGTERKVKRTLANFDDFEQAIRLEFP